MLTSNMLRGLACLFMVSDHLWATIVPGNMWMNYIGRLAFPIFAFQIAEGYRHTSDFRKYAMRLFLFGLISEIPFNLMYAGGFIFPFHQNVMFTLLLGLLSIRAIDTIRQNIQSHASAKSSIKPILALAGCLLLATVGFVDYGFWGVMTVILFHVFRDFRGARILQLAAMIYIHCEAYKGMFIPVDLFGNTIEFATQGFAVLALIPIWLYNGRQGRKSKAIQYGFYAFYPVHMLVLALIRMYFL